MFKTLRSKILFITILVIAIFMAVVLCYTAYARMKTKKLMLKNYSLSVNSFVEEIDKKILRMEDNSRDLALIGKLFYRTDKSIGLTNQAITKIFENYPDSLGGGIWFEPYIVDPAQKRTCFYAFRNKKGELVLDESFASEKYDYHNQNWYNEIKSQLTKDDNTAWSLPYYENQGSETMMITAGSGIYDGDKLIGISTVDWELSSIFKELSEMKPLENGFALFEQRRRLNDSFAILANNDFDYIIVSTDPYLDNKNLVGKSLKNIPWYKDNLKWITYIDYHGKKYVPFVKYTQNGLVLII